MTKEIARPLLNITVRSQTLTGHCELRLIVCGQLVMAQLMGDMLNRHCEQCIVEINCLLHDLLTNLVIDFHSAVQFVRDYILLEHMVTSHCDKLNIFLQERLGKQSLRFLRHFALRLTKRNGQFSCIPRESESSWTTRLKHHHIG